MNDGPVPMRKNHSISKTDEDKSYKSQDGRIMTTCDTCGIRVKVEIESKYENKYNISKLQKS